MEASIAYGGDGASCLPQRTIDPHLICESKKQRVSLGLVNPYKRNTKLHHQELPRTAPSKANDVTSRLSNSSQSPRRRYTKSTSLPPEGAFGTRHSQTKATDMQNLGEALSSISIESKHDVSEELSAASKKNPQKHQSFISCHLDTRSKKTEDYHSGQKLQHHGDTGSLKKNQKPEAFQQRIHHRNITTEQEFRVQNQVLPRLGTLTRQLSLQKLTRPNSREERFVVGNDQLSSRTQIHPVPESDTNSGLRVSTLPPKISAADMLALLDPSWQDNAAESCDLLGTTTKSSGPSSPCTTDAQFARTSAPFTEHQLSLTAHSTAAQQNNLISTSPQYSRDQMSIYSTRANPYQRTWSTTSSRGSSAHCMKHQKRHETVSLTNQTEPYSSTHNIVLTNTDSSQDLANKMSARANNKRKLKKSARHTQQISPAASTLLRTATSVSKVSMYCVYFYDNCSFVSCSKKCHNCHFWFFFMLACSFMFLITFISYFPSIRLMSFVQHILRHCVAIVVMIPFWIDSKS